MWTREALEVIEQCVSLPGETSQIVRHYLRQQCISRGCETLNQLQLLIRISGRANSVLELLLLRLDEQGLDISSLWMINGDDPIVSVLCQSCMHPGSAKSNRQAAERSTRMCGNYGSRLSFV
jgi:hypothetical protein